VIFWLPIRNYQTIYEGLLAFLAVMSPRENTSEQSKSSVFMQRRLSVRIRAIPWFFLGIGLSRAAHLGFLGYEEHVEKETQHNEEPDSLFKSFLP
jgi:hypothetical protein